jgi:PAS domain S-box-containing protein
METCDIIKILAIDDISDNLTTLSAVVRDALPQTRVLTATNGPDGIALAAAQDPDVILLDVVMPGMDGFEVCRRLKADEPLKDIPVVFLTAFKTDAATRVKALETGAEGFLAKPLEPVELTSQIRAMAKVKQANRRQQTEKTQLEALVAERTQALQAKEALFRNLFEKHTAVKLVVDPLDGRIVDANEAAASFYGWSRDELRRMKVMDINTLPPEQLKARMEDTRTGKQTFFEFRHRRADGSVRDVAVYSSRIESDGKDLLHSIIHDITGQKTAQKKLGASYTLLKIAGQTARFGGWGVDLGTNIMTWSDAVADIHEMPRGHAPAVSEGIQFYAPEWREKIQQVFTDCVQKGIPYDEQMEIITRTGKRVWVRTTGEVVRDNTGHIVKVQGSFQDITQSKKNYDALQQANEQLRKNYQKTRRILEDLKAEVQAREAKEAELSKVTLAVEQAGETIVITDPDGTIQYVNPAFETVTGYSRTEVLGQNPRILNSGEQDEAFYQQLWKEITSGRIWQGRMVNKRKDGKKFTEEATISPVIDGAGNIINYVAVKRDITEQLALSAQYQQAQKMDSIGRLAGGVAHDYNNMISIILGYTQLIMGKTDSKDPLYADLSEIYQAAQRSTEITRKLLAFARKQTISPMVLDLNTVVEAMLKLLRRLLREDLTLSWHPGTGVWQINIDPSQVDQILLNLCVNARDAIAGTGEIIIETKNRVFDPEYCELHKGFIPGEFVMLAVSDNGCGMDKNTLDLIFEPFFTTKKVGQGTGLGLPMVYGIMKQNKGFINVYSEPDQGTTFKMYFPRDKSGTQGQTESEQKKPETGRGETILLVEDEPPLLILAKRLLESLNYKVLDATGPKEALRLAENHAGKIRLLLTDVVMPEMNGRELADRLSAEYPDIKHLFMSGYTADVIASQGVLEKGTHFIQKPLSIHELAAKLRQILENKK